MIRRIVTCSLQNGSKTIKEIPIRCRTFDANGGTIRNVVVTHHRSFGSSTIKATATLQLRSVPRNAYKLWFSTSNTLEVDDNEDDIDNDDDVDVDDDEPSPPIGPTVAAKFAVVHHGPPYQKAMNGLHGQQLAIAQLEGEGKDEPDFDPFLEEELEEARLLYEEEKLKQRQKEESTDKANAKTTTDTTSSAKAKEVQDEAEDPSDEMDGENKSDNVVDTSSPQYQHKLFRQKYNVAQQPQEHRPKAPNTQTRPAGSSPPAAVQAPPKELQRPSVSEKENRIGCRVMRDDDQRRLPERKRYIARIVYKRPPGSVAVARCHCVRASRNNPNKWHRR